MFIRVKAFGVKRFINKDNLENEIKNLKTASDFEVEVDDNGSAKLYSGAEVSEILNPSSSVKVSIDEIVGIKKPTRKAKADK